jgi:hypothetical protein
MNDYKEKGRRAKLLLVNLTNLMGHYNLDQGDPVAVTRIVDELMAEITSLKQQIEILNIGKSLNIAPTIKEAVKVTVEASKKNKGGRPRKNKEDEEFTDNA